MRSRFPLWALTASLAEAAHSGPLIPTEEAAHHHGFQIFNAVHNAMRQWGSSLHHNGMSFFLAHVPAGVLFHHGNSSPDTPLDHPDWVAFEIEHAEHFARARGPRTGPDGPAGWLHTYRTTKPMTFLYIDGMSAGKTTMGTLDSQDYILRNLTTTTSTADKTHHHIAPPQLATTEDGRSNPDLKRRRHQFPLSREGPPRPPQRFGPMDEAARAADICALCAELGLQGAIRMEAGFEIIKCDFSVGFEQVQALQRPSDRSAQLGKPSRRRSHSPAADLTATGVAAGPLADPQRPGFGPPGNLEYLRGLSERYDSIGGERVVLDFSSMTSAFFFPVNLTNPDHTRPDLPRLLNTTYTEREAIKTHLVDTIAKRHHADSLLRPPSMNWQGVSDMIVGRYADRVRYMAEEVDNLELMEDELSFLLTIYVDYSSFQDSVAPSASTESGEEKGKIPDIEAAMKRCTDFYIPNIAAQSPGVGAAPSEADRLIHVAFTRVTGEMCKVLFDMYTLITGANAAHSPSHDTTTVPQKTTRESDQARSEVLSRIKTLAKELLTTLKWTRFKKCNPACGLGEVCIVPMWPMGTVEEYERPTCANQSAPGGAPGDGKRYWGDPRTRPQRPGNRGDGGPLEKHGIAQIGEDARELREQDEDGVVGDEL